MVPLQIKPSDKILVVAPHPDDECIGAGGILCQHAAQCTVLVLTDGALGQGNISTEEGRKIRRQEFIREMGFLGVEQYRFLDIPDGTLMNVLDCMEGIDLSPYTKIFVPGEHDGHPDHTAAFYCLARAIEYQRTAVAEVFRYEVHKELGQPTHYIDITQCMDKKMDAIRYHQSQIRTMPYERYAAINAECRALQNRQAHRYWEVYEQVESVAGLTEGTGEMERELQKFRMFYQVLTRWMLNADRNTLAEILKKRYNITACAIYGYAELGKILLKQLRESDIAVAYILDKKQIAAPEDGIRICYPDRELEKPDAVIVTAVYYYDAIKMELQDLGYHNIYSLYDLVTNI